MDDLFMDAVRCMDGVFMDDVAVDEISGTAFFVVIILTPQFLAISENESATDGIGRGFTNSNPMNTSDDSD